jgi:PST family polysaccharide transporter
MSAVFTGFVALFSNLGFGPALIQRREIDKDYVSTAFTATVVVSFVLFGALWSAAPAVSWFYREELVGRVVRIAALSFLLTPLNAILASVLMREMRFRTLAAIDVTCALTSQLVAVTTALLGFGLWSLVVGGIAYQLVRMPLLLVKASYRPRILFDVARFRRLLAFGGNVLGFNFVNYFSRNLDNLIIGKALGAEQLGFYDLAYQIMLKPLQNISHTITQPLFPALAELQNDDERAGGIYLKVVAVISLITFPMMLGLIVVADRFVMVVFGEKWLPAVPILQVLCVVGAMQSIGATVGDIYQAKGRTDVMLRVGVTASLLICFAFFVGVLWGALGVAVAYAVTTAALWVYTHYRANALIRLPNLKFWKGLLPAARMSAIMMIVVWLMDIAFARLPNLNDGWILCMLVSSGICIYTAMLMLSKDPVVYALRRTILREVRDLLARGLQRAD